MASFKTYIAALNRLPDEQKKTLIELLTTYVEKVLDSEDAYKSWRYDQDGNHLKAVFSNNPGVKDRWMRNVEMQLVDASQGATEEASAQAYDFKTLLLYTLNNNHISKEEYPDLHRG